MTPEPSPWLHAALGLVALVAALYDIRTRLLPDWLTIGGMILGLGLALVLGGWDGLVASFFGLLTGLAVFWLLYSLGMMGGGDVLLMGAMGAFLAWPAVTLGLLYATLAGALLGLGFSAARGNLLRVFRNLWVTLASTVNPRRRRVALSELPTDEIPYAVAIGLGSVWAALTAYVPALALV